MSRTTKLICMPSLRLISLNWYTLCWTLMKTLILLFSFPNIFSFFFLYARVKKKISHLAIIYRSIYRVLSILICSHVYTLYVFVVYFTLHSEFGNYRRNSSMETSPARRTGIVRCMRNDTFQLPLGL